MKDERNWYEATNMADIMSAVFTADYMFIRRKTLRRVIRQIQAFDFSFGRKKTSANEKLNKLVIATLLFFITYLIIVSNAINSWDINYVFNDYFPVFNSTDFHSQIKAFFVFSEWCFYVLYGWGTVAFFILLYSEIVFSLRDHFDTFCTELENTSKNNVFLSIHYFRQYLRKHDDLCDLVTEVDDVFSSVVISWFAHLLVAICVEVNGFLAGENETVLAVGGSLIITFDLVYAIIAMIIICITGGSVYESYMKSVPVLVKLSHSKSVSFRALYRDIQLLIIKISGHPIYLTAGKCFVISRGLILTFLSLLLSYILLLAQMNPKAMKYMLELNN
ncbi:uncharacterized protein [Centruroides vittatus]|uniref:uncharacterized protein n=1 Tax=Centruroides vittatus TaxID=120091 RepID=UPI00350EC4F7